jgi:hypothetical protein
MTRLVEEDNNNNEPVVLSERFKALLEELRTIDRVSDYTTGSVEEGWIIRQIRMRYDKRNTKGAVKID